MHEGQGTANVCFGFAGWYLELLYITDAGAVRAPAVSRMRLWERAHWRDTGVSPLGVCLRRADGGPGGAWPVPTWAYGAAYLPAGEAIPIAEDEEGSAGPLLFFAPWARAVGDPLERRRVQSVRIESPVLPRWAGPIAGAAPWLIISRGEEHRMVIELGGGGGAVTIADGRVTVRL